MPKTAPSPRKPTHFEKVPLEVVVKVAAIDPPLAPGLAEPSVPPSPPKSPPRTKK